MPRGIARKWRPSLALVLGLTVAAVLCLPLAGVAGISLLFPLVGYRMAVLSVALMILVLAGTLAWVLWRILLRPITTLADRAEAVVRAAPGALDPLPHYGTQEMERLGRVVIEMGRVLSGREAVLRSYADHATHELKSPLTVLRGAAELLEIEGLPPEDRARLIDRIDRATDRMSNLLDAQRRLARAQDPLMAGVTRLADLMPGLRTDHPDLGLIEIGEASLPLSAEGLRLVLDHLLSNAAAVGATEVRLTVREGELTVADNGPGVSEGNRDRIFDPFFTTRRAGGGTGMGLPIVRRMLEAHGATITLEGGPPGACFVIRF
jgi:signal transduction histidine kinase